MKHEINEKYKNSQVLSEIYTDLSEIYLIATDPDSEHFNKFVLIWGDYVANVWEEEYELLSTATARMAQLIYVNEREPEGEIIGFEKHGDEFTEAWKEFNNKTTIIMEGTK
jgi:hypothetical protein